MNNLEKLRNPVSDNPVFLLFLAACPAMGASVNLQSAAVLGMTVLAISLITALLMSLIRGFLADWALLWAGLIISAGLASIAQLIIEALTPGIYSSVSLYVTVCAVSLMIFSASQAGIKESFKSGLIFLAAILCTAFIRELLGNASVLGNSISVMADYKVPMLTKAPGGFIVFAVVLALVNALTTGKRKESK